MELAVFTYASVLTGGNSRLFRVLSLFPNNLYTLFIPEDSAMSLEEDFKRAGVVNGFINILKGAVRLKPIGKARSALDLIKYGEYVAKEALAHGAKLLYLPHEHVYFPIGFNRSGVRWTMLMQLTPTIGSLVVEEGRMPWLYIKNYRLIYYASTWSAVRSYLRFFIGMRALKGRRLLASSASVPYELERLGYRLNITLVSPPNAVEEMSCGNKEKDIDVGFYSRVVPEKGYRDFIFALKKIKFNEATLMGFAREDAISEVKGLLAKHGLEGRVELKFNLKREEAMENLSRVKVLIYPSRMDSFSLSVLEALSCRTPVVAYGIPGIRLNYKTRAVRIVRPLDVDGLAREAEQLLESGAWQELGEEGAKYAKGYRWEDVAKNELRALESMLGGEAIN